MSNPSALPTTSRDQLGARSSSYVERSLSIASSPIELAVRIAQASAAEWYAIYERQGEWSVALDAAWTVRVDADGVARSVDGEEWRARHPCRAIAHALRAAPFAGFRAYGRADFEFAWFKYGLPPAPDETLLYLTIPRCELRLRSGQALLRCLDERELPERTRTLRALDATSANTGGGQRIQAELRSAATEERYTAQVAAALAEIHAGQYSKVILSRSIELPAELDMASSYLRGRVSNTPARSFLLKDGSFECYGFSPETIVEVASDGWASTQPLAGTRALQGDPVRDAQLRSELLADPKEVAEHAVSVRLALEELQEVCLADSVAVSEFMAVRQRGSVQHLASRVRGRLAPQRNAWNAFESLFPAVTASGIPKREALESIRRHEPHPRALYSGAVLTADDHGNLDASLVLRSVYRDASRCWLQVGAGIVAMSTPAREWEETCEKAGCIGRHLYRG